MKKEIIKCKGQRIKATTHLLSCYGIFEIITSANNLVIFLFRSLIWIRRLHWFLFCILVKFVGTMRPFETEDQSRRRQKNPNGSASDCPELHSRVIIPRNSLLFARFESATVDVNIV